MTDILYRGPSMLDGQEIVVLASKRRSKNPKTGPMIQVFILLADVSPMEGIRQGKDVGICGACALRGRYNPETKRWGHRRSCYVLVHRSPTASWLSFHKGFAKPVKDLTKYGRGRRIRLGAYGDPMAAPTWVWEALLAEAEGWTGYTHQWNNHALPNCSHLLTASCDTTEQRQEAKQKGYQTFRITLAEDDRKQGEFPCPAALRPGKIQCVDCLRCDGHGKDVNIVVHGDGAKVKAFKELLQ